MNHRRNIEAATALAMRLARAFESELVPEDQRMNTAFWPSVAEGVPIGLIKEGVIKYPPIEVQL